MRWLMTTFRPTLGDDDLPTSDRHDYASLYHHWQPDTQPPSDADGVEEVGEEDELRPA
jgi:hypothetical protein